MQPGEINITAKRKKQINTEKQRALCLKIKNPTWDEDAEGFQWADNYWWNKEDQN